MAKETQSESEHSGVESMASDDSFQFYLETRTLENTCPILSDFLKPDMNVLDVGCGPGSVTLGVARELSQGAVTGMDMNEDALKNARKMAVEARLSNIEFKKGDVYSLNFADETFDLVYSHALFEWIQRPAEALKEQARVTRKGGWVVAVIASWEFILLYPECPEFNRAMMVMREAKIPTNDIPFFNTFAPQEAVRFLVEAGFREYKIISFTPNIGVAYPGSEYLKYRYQSLVMMTTRLEKWRKHWVARGLIDENTFEKARADIEAWYHHPHALFIQPEVAACGQVD